MSHTRPEIRRIRADEIERLIPLCVEHAAFERARPIEISGLVDRLRARITSEHSPLFVWVAHINETLVGYASVTAEFSTWSGRDYWHLDCLYVVTDLRGTGIGRELMRAVCTDAFEQDIRELQWQTPDWNVDAQRFYSRLGASMQRKARFTLEMK
jgi:ribosomal protein S18 acetylase RimI-like enzyme